MQSNELGELFSALSKAQGEFESVSKGETNPFFKSKYAGLPDVVKAASPILAENGLMVSQFITQNETGEEGLEVILGHSSGQYISRFMKMHLSKLDSQGQGSATTYARRYSYMAVLGLVADEDDDGNRATQPAEGATRPTEARKPPTAVGSDDPRLNAILGAEGTGNTFIDDLCAKYRQYGKLSENQLNAGLNAATKPRGAKPVRNEPQPFTPEYDEEPL